MDSRQAFIVRVQIFFGILVGFAFCLHLQYKLLKLADLEIHYHQQKLFAQGLSHFLFAHAPIF